MGVGRYLNLSDAESRALLAGATVLLVPVRKMPDWFDAWARSPLSGQAAVMPYAPCAPGDTLHLREAWAQNGDEYGTEVIQYRAQGYLIHGATGSRRDGTWRDKTFPGIAGNITAPECWRSSQHMPAWAIRHHYPVKALSAIRVSEIWEEEALACGFEPAPVHGKWVDPAKGREGHWSARKPLHDWWQSRYPKLSWESSWAWKVGKY